MSRLRAGAERAFGGDHAGAFWTLVAIRAAFWVGAALALVWAPLPEDAGVRPSRAYDAASDLLAGTFGRWDATWFLEIAEHGYEEQPHSAVFFPLYPLVVRAVETVTGSFEVAGVLVSLLSAGIAAVLVAQLARPLLGARGARDSVLYVALYPFAFVFTAVYSDGLFLALAAGAFLAGLRGRPVVAGVLGALAVGTRLIGLALLPALLVLLWPRRPSLRELVRPLPLVLLPAAVAAFALYLEATLGDALAFAHEQEFWSRERGTVGPLEHLWDAFRTAVRGARHVLFDLPRSGTGFDHDDRVSAWNALHFPLLVGALGLAWVAWKRFGAAYGVYAFATILGALVAVPPWFPLQSFPRYMLGNFPLFLALAALTLERPRLRQTLLIAFAAVGAVAAVAFSRLVWVA